MHQETWQLPLGPPAPVPPAPGQEAESTGKKKKKKDAPDAPLHARHVVSLYVHTISGLPASVREGDRLRIKLKIDTHVERVAVSYQPGLPLRVAELQLPSFVPAREVMHGSLESEGVVRRLLGAFSIPVSDIPRGERQ